VCSCLLPPPLYRSNGYPAYWILGRASISPVPALFFTSPHHSLPKSSRRAAMWTVRRSLSADSFVLSDIPTECPPRLIPTAFYCRVFVKSMDFINEAEFSGLFPNYALCVQLFVVVADRRFHTLLQGQFLTRNQLMSPPSPERAEFPTYDPLTLFYPPHPRALHLLCSERLSFLDRFIRTCFRSLDLLHLLAPRGYTVDCPLPHFSHVVFSQRSCDSFQNLN